MKTLTTAGGRGLGSWKLNCICSQSDSLSQGADAEMDGAHSQTWAAHSKTGISQYSERDFQYKLGTRFAYWGALGTDLVWVVNEPISCPSQQDPGPPKPNRLQPDQISH